MRAQATAKVIADSISPEGVRLTTIQARYWRPIHPEVMTHRIFSRNGRSSRAVPSKVLLAEPIIEPISYGTNQKGMTAGEELSGWRLSLARGIWLGMAHMTKLGVRGLFKLGVHKQVANRPLEWFGCIDMLITTTDWNNWDALRIHPAAQPEIQDLAGAIYRARKSSTPMQLRPGEWHLPYVERTRIKNQMRYGDTDLERGCWTEFSLEDAKRISVARCARLTYKPFDGAGDIEAEIARHDRLVVSQPVHASPAEHQATPDTRYFDDHYFSESWENPSLHGNLRGYIQYRKTLPNEWVPG
jgi:hypothetical protein